MTTSERPARTPQKGSDRAIGFGSFATYLERLPEKSFENPESRRRVMASTQVLEQDWRAMGACSSTDPDLWFAVGAMEHKQAKRICRECPVQGQCLAYAMDAP